MFITFFFTISIHSVPSTLKYLKRKKKSAFNLDMDELVFEEFNIICARIANNYKFLKDITKRLEKYQKLIGTLNDNIENRKNV